MDRLFVAAPEAGLRQEDRRKAVEVAAMLSEVARALPSRDRVPAPVLVDAAAGKAYVGLLAAKLVLEASGWRSARVITIEREPKRAAVVAACLPVLACPVTIEVRTGDVSDAGLWPERPAIVAALHACGPAADTIIDRAIAAEAAAVLVVPCCTGRLVPAWQAGLQAAERLGIPRHAAVRGRFLQSFVDAERTLRLEAAGWQTEVVELCAPTVTPHNLLWRSRHVGEAGRMQEASRRRDRLLAGA